MTEEPDFHEYQDLVHDYQHLEMDDDLDPDDLGEFLEAKYQELSNRMIQYWNANEEVGRGRQGTKWRVKYKEALGRRDQVEQVYTELLERGLVEDDLLE